MNFSLPNLLCQIVKVRGVRFGIEDCKLCSVEEVGHCNLAGGRSKFDGSMLGVLKSKRYGAAPVVRVSSTEDDFHWTPSAGSSGSRKAYLRYGFEEGSFSGALVPNNCNLWELYYLLRTAYTKLLDNLNIFLALHIVYACTITNNTP